MSLFMIVTFQMDGRTDRRTSAISSRDIWSHFDVAVTPSIFIQSLILNSRLQEGALTLQTQVCMNIRALGSVVHLLMPFMREDSLIGCQGNDAGMTHPLFQAKELTLGSDLSSPW